MGDDAVGFGKPVTKTTCRHAMATKSVVFVFRPRKENFVCYNLLSNSKVLFLQGNNVQRDSDVEKDRSNHEMKTRFLTEEDLAIELSPRDAQTDFAELQEHL